MSEEIITRELSKLYTVVAHKINDMNRPPRTRKETKTSSGAESTNAASNKDVHLTEVNESEVAANEAHDDSGSQSDSNETRLDVETDKPQASNENSSSESSDNSTQDMDTQENEVIQPEKHGESNDQEVVDTTQNTSAADKEAMIVSRATKKPKLQYENDDNA